MGKRKSNDPSAINLSVLLLEPAVINIPAPVLFSIHIPKRISVINTLKYVFINYNNVFCPKSNLGADIGPQENFRPFVIHVEHP